MRCGHHAARAARYLGARARPCLACMHAPSAQAVASGGVPMLEDAHLVHAHMAIALDATGAAGEAVAACRTGLALRPDYADGHLLLADCLLRANQPLESLGAALHAHDLGGGDGGCGDDRPVERMRAALVCLLRDEAAMPLSSAQAEGIREGVARCRQQPRVREALASASLVTVLREVMATSQLGPVLRELHDRSFVINFSRLRCACAAFWVR